MDSSHKKEYTSGMLNAACPLHKVKRRSSFNKENDVWPSIFCEILDMDWLWATRTKCK